MQPDAVLESVFTPVRPPTTFEETVERLGTAIRAGILPAGSRLPAERTLADQLGISRSTLRQALTTLVQSGHLVSLRGRGGGTFVTERPPLAERDGEAARRGGLGGARLPRGDRDRRHAARRRARASRRARPPRRARRDEAMRGVEDFEVYRRADIRFHIGLAEAARSPRLVSAMTEVQGQMSDLITLIAHPPEVLHARQRAAPAARAAAAPPATALRAVRLMREHIEGTEHILAGLI